MCMQTKGGYTCTCRSRRASTLSSLSICQPFDSLSLPLSLPPFVPMCKDAHAGLGVCPEKCASANELKFYRPMNTFIHIFIYFICLYIHAYT